MSISPPDIFSVTELAELFNCDPETVASRIISGDLPGVKFGRGWIIPREALLERLNEKARKESAQRRLDAENLPRYLINNGKITQHKVRNDSSSILVESFNQKSGGRKRRTPPLLPSLPNQGN